MMIRDFDMGPDMSTIGDLAQHIPYVWPVFHLRQYFGHIHHFGLKFKVLLSGYDSMTEFDNIHVFHAFTLLSNLYGFRN
jgi:hypothetical protein